MAMSGTVLGAQIASIIADADASDDMKAQITSLWQDIASAIVSHIQTYGTVTVTVATTGSATAQSGTGSGTIA